MKLSKLFFLGLAVLAGATFTVAQQPDEPFGTLPTRKIELGRTTPVNTVVGPGIALPIACGPTGTIVARFAATFGVGAVTAVRPDGTAIAFSPEKMTDTPKARAVAFFPNESGVFLLTRTSSAGQPSTTTLPNGKTAILPGEIVDEHYYVSAFDWDGGYRRSIVLDLPFRPQQLGVFKSGYLIVAGVDTGGSPKLALVTPSGRLDRFLSEALVQGPEMPEAEEKETLRSAPFARLGQGSVSTIVASAVTQFVADGEQILFVRREQNAPILVIRDSGEWRAVRVKIPKQAVIFSLHVTSSGWIVLITDRMKDRQGLRVNALLVNRGTGVPVERFVTSGPVGLAWGCVDESRFLFIKHSEQRGIFIVNGLPTPD